MKIKFIFPIIFTFFIFGCGAGGSSESGTKSSIIVIGAGVAGLAAAKTMRQNGHSVIVLEARDRIGGRLWSNRSISGVALDMGASWIHGITNNPIHKIATDLSLPLSTTDYSSIRVYDANGNADPFSENSEVRFQRNLTSTVETLIEASPEANIQDAVNIVLSEGGEGDLSTAEVNYLLNTTLEHEYAADVGALSVMAPEEGYDFGGDDVVFPDGFDRIASYLSNGIDVRLNRVVKAIDYSGESIEVTTMSGESFMAEKVLVTVPLGVLKKGSIQFIPSLPDNKRIAIQSLGMGILNKVYLEFPNVFWDNDVHLIGHVSNPNKGRWAEWLNIRKYTGSPILLGFNAGAYGEEIEHLSNDQIVSDAMGVLRNLYGASIPEPVGVLITRWGSDPYSYGSYSYLKSGADISMRQSLAAPIEGKLFFAGEATESDYPATVHGAYLSGVREANRID